MGNDIINVQGTDIKVTNIDEQDYICITDMCKVKDGDFFISDWLRNRNTIEFLGIWESINNPDFNYGEFAVIKSQTGLNSYKLSVKEWVQKTNAIGLTAKAGRYGGTYAHKDIAFEFGMWISPQFKLYLIREFQRLKEAESKSGKIEWNMRRTLSKAQYRVQTDAIKNNLIPEQISTKEAGYIYASEADLLNRALFGCTAKEWKTTNPNVNGNIRDNASIEQLVVLTSLESQNALLIEQGLPQEQRLQILNGQAIQQLKSILNNPSIQKMQHPLID